MNTLQSGVNRRHTLSHIDLSNVEEFDDDEDDDGDDSEASRRRRRRRLVDSVSSLLDGGPRVPVVPGSPGSQGLLGHPVVAFLMGTRRSIKRRRRGRLTVSNLLRDRVGRIGSMTNLSSSSSTTSRMSSPCPPPVSCLIRSTGSERQRSGTPTDCGSGTTDWHSH